ncbi:30854_t:CDS:2, partial [Gigaspora margarita]
NSRERNIEDEFQLPKGWALLGNTRFSKKGGEKKIKPKVVSILKQLFLNGNLNPKDKLTAKEMHEELLKFAHSGEIDEDYVPKVDTIQNWIGRYSRKFNQKGTVIELETFKATSSSSNGKD